MGETFNDQHFTIAVVNREDNKEANEDLEIGLNSFEQLENGSIEIFRNYDYLPADNLSFILSKLSHLVPLDESNEIDINEDAEDWLAEDPAQIQRTNATTNIDPLESIEGPSLASLAPDFNSEFWDSWDEDDLDEEDIIPMTPNAYERSLFTIPETQEIISESRSNNRADTPIPTNGTRSIKSPDLFSDEENERDHWTDNYGTVLTMEVGDKPGKRRRTKDDSEDDKSLSIIDRIKEAQKRDDDTLEFIEIIKMNLKPSDIEIKPESEYCNALNEVYDSLNIKDGYLWRKTTDNLGDTINTIVVPPAFSKQLAVHIHEQYCHVSTFKLERLLAAEFFIYDLKRVARDSIINCHSCLMALPPKIQKPRKIRTFTHQENVLLSMCSFYQNPVMDTHVCLSLSMSLRRTLQRGKCDRKLPKRPPKQ